mgnify:CR=1 FL=1
MNAPSTNSSLEFTVADFPEFVLKNMAMAAIDLTKAILAQPGGRELLDAETAARKARERK